MKRTLLIVFAGAAVLLPCPAAEPAKSAATSPAIDRPTAAELLKQPLSLSLGTLQTRAREAALRLAIDYGNSLVRNDEYLHVTSGTAFWKVEPEFHILSGDEDAFQGVVAKIKALHVQFSRELIDVDGVMVPNLDKPIHTFPFSAGAEADGDFQTVNGIAEVGYVPWLSGPPWDWVSAGVFLQAGYKFRRDEDADEERSGDEAARDGNAGDIDQSAEEEQETIARLKASLLLKTPEYPILSTFHVQLLGGADGWFDAINSEVYHRVTGTFRIVLSKDRYFDLTYEHGSGAPNFNRGDQFSANLTVTF